MLVFYMTSRIEKLHLSKTDNGYLELDFTRLYSRSFQTPLNNLKQSFGKIGQKGENYDPTVEFKENCFDFHIGLETWFKVTAHPFPTSTIYVKYKPKVEIIHNYTWS